MIWISLSVLVAASASATKSDCRVESGYQHEAFVETVKPWGKPMDRHTVRIPGVDADQLNSLEYFNRSTACEYPWARDKKAIYYRGHVVDGADVKSFRALDEHFGRDKQKIYARGKPIALVNPSAFKALGSGYGKAYPRVYWYEQEVARADFGSFAVNSDGLGVDKAQVYFEGHGYPRKTFRKLGPLYVTVGPYVLLQGRPVADADGATAQLVHHEYFKDKNAVFHGESRLTTRDAASFKAAPGNIQGAPEVFTMDKHGVYYKDVPIPGADINTFKVRVRKYGDTSDGFICPMACGEDEGHIYSAQVDGFDERGREKVRFAKHKRAQLKSVDSNYAIVDGQVLYLLSEIINGADAASFQPLGAPWSRDAKRVYCATQAKLELDANSLRLYPVITAATKVHGSDCQGRRYAKDAKRVYLLDNGSECGISPAAGDVIPDPATFQPLGNAGFAKDKTHVFHCLAHRPDLSVKSFKVPK